MQIKKYNEPENIPVFFISFNRGKMLKKSIEGLNHLKNSITIIIHDNGSSDEETIKILKELEDNGILIYRNPPINYPEDLNKVNDTIEKYFKKINKKSRYVVSDCDIDLSEANSDIFFIYNKILDIFEDIECVGPMLRIEDISHSYPLRSHALNRHIEQFWHNKPSIVKINNLDVGYQYAKIDTTMALHRAEKPFYRLKKGIRTYKPFEAKHLDWYENGDISIKYESKNEISHWSNSKYISKYINETLKYYDYYNISYNESGRAEILKAKIK